MHPYEPGFLAGRALQVFVDHAKCQESFSQCTGAKVVRMEELRLDSNKIGAAGAKSLAAMMAVRASLTEVGSASLLCQ